MKCKYCGKELVEAYLHPINRSKRACSFCIDKKGLLAETKTKRNLAKGMHKKLKKGRVF